MKKLLKYLYENYGFSGIYKELKTTVLGVLLAIAPLYFVYTEKASMGEVVPLLLALLPFLLYKSKSQKEGQ